MFVISDKQVESKSTVLAGKCIAFGVCGGIGAVETVKLIRELRRHGAKITTFLTPSATRFITELSLSWATQGRVISEAGADVDHLDPFDLVIVAPVTLNSLAKFALGLTDNAVALLVAGQLGGGRPVGLVPAMNAVLLNHPQYAQYQTTLKTFGAHFFPSGMEEGRLKMPPPEAFANWVMELMSGN